MQDDLGPIIESLRAKRAEHLVSVETFDKAIALLQRLAEGPVRGVTYDDAPRVTPSRGKKLKPRSMNRQIVGLLDDEDLHDWCAEEVVAEAERRGTPFNVTDPVNAVRSAMARLARAGEIMRTKHGRYASLQYSRAGDSLVTITSLVPEPAHEGDENSNHAADGVVAFGRAESG